MWQTFRVWIYAAWARFHADNHVHGLRCALRRHASEVRAVCGSAARTDLCGVVSRTCSKEHDAVSKMKGGPSESADRSRFQTAVSCWRRKTAGGERYGKGAAFRSRHVGVRETSANELLMRHRNRSSDDIKTGRPPRSGKSIAVTY